MAEKIPCSVPILTLNCTPALERMLPVLVPVIEDVYILDGNSTDDTQAYAQSLGVRIEKQFDTDEPNQRITDFYAMRMRLWSKAKTDWLFLLDADEIPTPELIERVREIVADNNPMVVHRFRRIARLPDGRIVKHAFFYPDLYIRLFNTRSGATLAKRAVHERFVLPEGIEEVDHEEALIAPWPTPQKMWEKSKRYVSMEMENIQPTWGYLWRWVIVYNLRSAIGQSFRVLACYWRGLMRHEIVLPWSYNIRMIGYRYLHLTMGVRAWLAKRRTP